MNHSLILYTHHRLEDGFEKLLITLYGLIISLGLAGNLTLVLAGLSKKVRGMRRMELDENQPC